MTVQVPDQQRRYDAPRRNHVVFRGLAIAFLIAVAAIWVANIGNGLSAVLSAVFTLLSVLLTLLQWQPLPWQKAQMLSDAMPETGKDEQQPHGQIQGVALDASKHKGTLIVTVHTDPQELVTKVSIVAGKVEEGNWP